MSMEVIVATPEDDLNYAVNVMKQKRIRHLPVVADQKVLGMISMRDLLGVQLAECTTEIRHLNAYISHSLW